MKRVRLMRRLAAVACCGLVALPLALTASSSAATGDQAFITKVCALPKPWISRILNGYRSDWSGDVSTIPKADNIVDGGYSHAGPMDHLQHVPMFYYAPGIVKPGVYTDTTFLTDIAPTTGAILKFPFNAPDGKPLTEALLPPDQRTVPKLFVTLVWDAGGMDVLDTWSHSHPYLDSLKGQGAWFTNTYVGSAQSNTPPGHAEIGTGAFPKDNGYIDEYVRLNNHTVQPTQDGPGLLLTPTFGDLYDIAHGNKPVVGAVATLAAHDLMMSHGAWFNGGDKDIAVMRQVDAATTGGAESVSWNLTSQMSPYYTFPAWVNDLPGIGKYNTIIDQADGKRDGKWRDKSISALRTGFDTPARTPYETSVIEAVMKRYKFGQDATPDLLYLNYKTIDTTEHQTSLNSPYMEDSVAYQDAALKQLVAFLNKEVGKDQWGMVITADHGSQYSAAVAGGVPIDPTRVRALLDTKFDPSQKGLFEVVRPTQMWFNAAVAKQLGVTPEVVASYVGSLTVAQTARSYYSIPPGTEGDTVYAAAFPSHILTGLPCAPAAPPASPAAG
ncbi:MAG: alkaline phosphatase family protein [Actinomycetota bacterium]